MKVLSKSPFKLGLECPNKLYYTGKLSVFPNKNSTDTFLLALANGGIALTAYAKLQYQDMTDKERDEITGGLLKYCELDTLAMVMIYEHFKEICL
ncbi:MAG: hypothetical protein RL108_1732 [Bacteroidota bacterium]|jgi:hypothetical protein